MTARGGTASHALKPGRESRAIRQPWQRTCAHLLYVDTMRFLQWNVLNRPFDPDLWTSSKMLDLLDVIWAWEPDAATLQEVPVGALDAMRTALGEHRWSMVAGDPAQERGDVSVIAWRRSALRQHLLPVGSTGQTTGSNEPDLAKTPSVMTYAGMNVDAVTVCLETIVDDGPPFVFSLTSYHGYWGAAKQGERMMELQALDESVSRFDTAADVMCGDFNATRNEPGIRWLMGEEIAGDPASAGSATFWTEAQEVAVALGRQDFPVCTTLNTGVAEETAKPHGINPALMPKRRIDFMVSRGWNYGKRGGWTGDVMVREHDGLSDHALMVADVIN